MKRVTRTWLIATTGLVAAVGMTGCSMGLGRSSQMEELMRAQQEAIQARMGDQETMMARQQLLQEIVNNPDLPAWHEQREKMSLAIGDRQFEQSFERVFDSMIVALASLGCRVNNMERVSGYITGSIPELPPAQLEALQKEALRQYAVAKGYSADIFDKPSLYDIDPNAMMSRYMSGLTLSMVRQTPTMTKVKLRFDNVYYPGLVDQYYAVVWRAVDKQMFLDKGLD